MACQHPRRVQQLQAATLPTCSACHQFKQAQQLQCMIAKVLGRPRCYTAPKPMRDGHNAEKPLQQASREGT